MSGLSLAVQSAVFNALDGSAPLSNLLAPHNVFPRSAIYDRMPQPVDSGNNDLFPLITIGEDGLEDWSTDTSSGGDVVVNVHIWSRSPGWAEAKGVSGAVYDALHRNNLSTPGFDFVHCEFDGERMLRDDDGITLHIHCEYRMRLEENHG